jgi:hypothetical protein
MLDKFHLHLTPDDSRIRLDKGRFAYKYMNKPFVVLDCSERVLGLNHATNQPVPPEIENHIIVLNGSGNDFTSSHDARLSK